jgi:PhoP regulatory network protein YrbL
MLTEQDRLIKLIGLVPFGRGGKRDCFVHPRDHAWCIKVPRLDRLPSILHRDASMFTRWRKSINDMDENV